MRHLALPLFAAVCAFAGQQLGKPLTLKESSTVARVTADASNLAGSTVQVKGTVAEVCQMMGCWMALTGGGKSIRIKVNDGDIVFPKEAVGRTAIAEGKLTKIELTKEQAIERARHEAEEQGRKFNPAKVKGGLTIYQIDGTGAVLLD